MPSFLKDISGFYGTGEKNAAGQTLEEFLEAYDPRKYQTPSCTTDAVIFAKEGRLTEELNGLKILLVKRSNHPSIGFWALPGGFANMKEDLRDTARRELEEETKVAGVTMEQFATYGEYRRDPRTRVITTAYMALVEKDQVKVQAGDDAADALWWDLHLECLKSDKIEQQGKELKRELYQLCLKQPEHGEETSVLVEHRKTMGLIQEQWFEVKDSGKVAVDHGAIMVQALLILKERLVSPKYL